jgi:hypothetical protein
MGDVPGELGLTHSVPTPSVGRIRNRTSGGDVTLENLFKIGPGVLAVLAATLRLLPGAATAARRQESEEATVSLNMRVRNYSAPLPWSKGLDKRFKSEEGTARIRTRSVWVCSLAIPGVAFIAFVYVVLAAEKQFPWWSITIAIALALAIIVVLIRLLIGLQRNPRQYTGAAAVEGSISVDGRREDVEQYCLAALRGMGARLIEAEGRHSEGEGSNPTENRGTTVTCIYAATGVPIIGPIFVGERIALTIQSAGSRHKVEIESLKLDYVTPSRSKKNVMRFLELWAFYPSSSR